MVRHAVIDNREKWVEQQAEKLQTSFIEADIPGKVINYRN
jgi:hypothetical protein